MLISKTVMNELSRLRPLEGYSFFRMGGINFLGHLDTILFLR